jgi:hypothetical protein
MITYFAVIALIFFVSGFGWGKWFAERSIRKERIELEQGRLIVSVPMHKDEAQFVFETLKNLAKWAEEMRDE